MGAFDAFAADGKVDRGKNMEGNYEDEKSKQLISRGLYIKGKSPLILSWF